MIKLSASEVTTIWRYTNVYIIIILLTVFYGDQESSKTETLTGILWISTLNSTHWNTKKSCKEVS